MTPAALASGNVQKEWRYARQQGVCVYPVKGAPDPDLHFANMPRWMSKAHFFDLRQEWPTFVAHLRKGDRRRVPFVAPDLLPSHFVQRPAEFDALKNLLLNPARTGPVAITTALSGAGGFGKTTLAAALCHDDDVVMNFDDGILCTLGQTPDVLGTLLTAYAALTGERPGFSSVADAAYQLGEKLEGRTCLLVIDDVWDQEHLSPFLRGGKSSARLFTTRDAETTPGGQPCQCRRDARTGIPFAARPKRPDPGSRTGTRPCQPPGRMAAGTGTGGCYDARAHPSGGFGLPRCRAAAPDHRAQREVKTEDPTAERRHRTISSVLEVSLDLLDAPSRRRMAELSIFPEDVSIPLATASAVWGLDEFDAEDLARRLARLSLLKLDLERGVLRLHDVMRSWLAATLADQPAIHNRLLAAWPDWQNLPDLPGEYAWRWLPWHLEKAERSEDLRRILWDPCWLRAKLDPRRTETPSLPITSDLRPSEADLLQGALRLSANVLAADTRQFTPQMVGRLLLHHDSPAIRQFIAEVAATETLPWLRPLHPALHPSGTAPLRTLEGMYPDAVAGVAVTPDGKRAVSASWDKMLKVWDLESGWVLRTLEGHSHRVSGVAVTADGWRAVSASEDKTLKVWDLETGRTLRTLERGTVAMCPLAWP